MQLVPVKSQPWPPLLWLASRSPRRRQLLTEAGLRHVAEHPGLEDSELVPGNVTPSEWVAALAYLKAAAGAEMARSRSEEPVLVLGADTACVSGDRLIGTPRSEVEAREMMHEFRSCKHDVVTGVALIAVFDDVWTLCPQRSLFVSHAVVEWGIVSDGQIDEYIASGQWEGKAGGYNLRERLSAGWPIEYSGDPTGVMGLPMEALRIKLDLLEGCWDAPLSAYRRAASSLMPGGRA